MGYGFAACRAIRKRRGKCRKVEAAIRNAGDWAVDAECDAALLHRNAMRRSPAIRCWCRALPAMDGAACATGGWAYWLVCIRRDAAIAA